MLLKSIIVKFNSSFKNNLKMIVCFQTRLKEDGGKTAKPLIAI